MRAVVDIGSNSIKVLVAKMQRGAFEKIYENSQVTGLGRNLSKNNSLSDESMEKSLQILNEYLKLIQEKAPNCPIVIVGTAALRKAKNANEFCSRFQAASGHSIQIISGQEEARLSILGATQSVPSEKKQLFIDVGGASTEIAIIDSSEEKISLEMGAAKTHGEMNFKSGSISNEEWQQLKRKIQHYLSNGISSERKEQMSGATSALAVGGSLVMAAESAGAQQINSDSFHIDNKTLKTWNERIRSLKESDRLQEAKITKDRAEILPTGVLILTEVLDFFQVEKLKITKFGLRHGVFVCEEFWGQEKEQQ